MADKEFVVIDGIPYQKFGDKLVANKEIHADCGKLVISDYNVPGIDFGSDEMAYHCEGCGASVVRYFGPIAGWSVWRNRY